jgi:predicted TIM-barrel enzyme
MLNSSQVPCWLPAVHVSCLSETTFFLFHILQVHITSDLVILEKQNSLPLSRVFAVFPGSIGAAPRVLMKTSAGSLKDLQSNSTGCL